ncbi:unnamed protein product, partial [Mesorhabditis spiculigera]
MREKYKIAVLGPSAVGKTAIVHQFVYNSYAEVYDPTIEETYKKSFFCGGALVDLEIVDTAGREHFPGMIDRYVENSDAFLVVYSISDRQGFERVPEMFTRIAGIRGPNGIARVLVGAQCDAARREVAHEEGAILSAEAQCSFAEVSAKHGLNVTEVFDELVAQMRYIRKQRTMPGMNTPFHPGPHPDQWYGRKKESWCCFM